MVWLPALLAIFGGYFLGSFPSGYLAARMAGVDIRKQGSGNIGATNVLRVLGKKYGYAVFFLDAFKGLAAVRLAFYFASRHPVWRDYAEFYAIIAAVACVLGHNFPVWLRFKGGKGVATVGGAYLGLMPIAAVVIFFLWVLVFEITRYVSIASVAAAAALPIAAGIYVWLGMTQGMVLFYFSLAMGLLVTWRHRANFSRLRKGTEQRFERK